MSKDGYFGMFILTLIAYILLIIFSKQKEKNKNLIIASFVLLFSPMIFLAYKTITHVEYDTEDEIFTPRPWTKEKGFIKNI